MKIQECVFDKIEDAYNEFKEEMLKKDPEEIFEKAYKISIITEIFDILFPQIHFADFCGYGFQLLLQIGLFLFVAASHSVIAFRSNPSADSVLV